MLLALVSLINPLCTADPQFDVLGKSLSSPRMAVPNYLHSVNLNTKVLEKFSILTLNKSFVDAVRQCICFLGISICNFLKQVSVTLFQYGIESFLCN